MTALKDPPTEILALISQGCRILHIPVDKKAIEKMIQYMDLIRAWVTKVNLTAIREPREIGINHFLDSLTVFKVIPLNSGLRILDVGTGAGFPGLVLKIVDPTLDLTLLDRDPKKIVFLKHVAWELKLAGITFLNTSVEKIIENPPIWKFDCVISRAFSSKKVNLETFSSMLASKGVVITMTGPSCKDVTLKNFELINFWEGNLPFSNKFRKVSLHQLSQ